MSRTMAATLLLSLVACATPGAPLLLTAPAEVGEGRLLSTHEGQGTLEIAYGPARVFGQGVDVTLQGGAWVGQVLTGPWSEVRTSARAHTRLTVGPGVISGEGVDLHVFDDPAARAVTVQGWVGGQRVRFTMGADAIDAGAYVLKRVSATEWAGEVGSRKLALRVEGDVALRSPQFILALVGALPTRWHGDHPGYPDASAQLARPSAASSSLAASHRP